VEDARPAGSRFFAGSRAAASQGRAHATFVGRHNACDSRSIAALNGREGLTLSQMSERGFQNEPPLPLRLALATTPVIAFAGLAIVIWLGACALSLM
jgi:hypothetical protein